MVHRISCADIHSQVQRWLCLDLLIQHLSVLDGTGMLDTWQTAEESKLSWGAAFSYVSSWLFFTPIAQALSVSVVIGMQGA